MKITYNGTVLAAEAPVFGGAEIISGFAPGFEGVVQRVPRPGAAYQALYDRGNFVSTLTGTITFAAQADLDAAMRGTANKFAALPRSGDLIIQESETSGTLWANAKLQSGSVPMRIGVRFSITLTFLAGVPADWSSS